MSEENVKVPPESLAEELARQAREAFETAENRIRLKMTREHVGRKLLPRAQSGMLEVKFSIEHFQEAFLLPEFWWGIKIPTATGQMTTCLDVGFQVLQEFGFQVEMTQPNNFFTGLGVLIRWGEPVSLTVRIRESVNLSSFRGMRDTFRFGLEEFQKEFLPRGLPYFQEVSDTTGIKPLLNESCVTCLDVAIHILQEQGCQVTLTHTRLRPIVKVQYVR